MKKTIIFTSIALCLSVVTVNAKTVSQSVNSFSTESVYKVNPFCVSIAKGDYETVKKLIELGEDVNKKSNGMTPVMYAAKFNRTDILNLLISKGAKLNEISKEGYTALKYAQLSYAQESIEIIKKALS